MGEAGGGYQYPDGPVLSKHSDHEPGVCRPAGFGLCEVLEVKDGSEDEAS